MKRKQKDLVLHSAGGPISGGPPLTGLPLASTPQTPDAVPQDQPGLFSGALFIYLCILGLVTINLILIVNF